MEKYNFVGKPDHIQTERKASEEFLEAMKNEPSFARRTEYQPSLLEREARDRALALIESEMRRLGINRKPQLTAERIHFSRDSYQGYRGMYDSGQQRVAIFKTPNLRKLLLLSSVRTAVLDLLKAQREKTDVFLLYLLVHEGTHAESVNKFFIKRDPRELSEYRSGYVVQNPKTREEFFQGLNEAVIEKFTVDLTQQATVSPVLKKIDSTLHKIVTTYPLQLEIMEAIVKRIAEKSKEEGKDVKTEKEIWEQFKKGLFTGNLMHLRKIEEIYGPGSLRILAGMPNRWPPDSSMKKHMKKFFVDNDMSVKEKLSKEIRFT